MGGGIAYTSASKGIATLMKDISEKQLALGMSEAMKIMGKQVERGKMTPAKMAETTARIRPMLTYGDFAASDFVVEAIVENEAVKKKVLPEVESHLKEGTILASNTSTISITRLASVLKRPEKFCGMHFFNPVHRMPLVEIIRGEKTSDETIATAVAYSTAMGKTAVVVNDCPGFLVNRVLFPYFSGFAELIGDGVDFKVIDKTMEKFGWPMGPAYLLDVVGIDTGVHADTVMAAGYPDRMTHKGKTPMDVMVEAKRFGQKNGTGFYKYTPDKKGPPKKEMDPSTYDLIKPCIRANKSAEINDQEIVERMMIPMIFESVRCLEDKIAASPIDIDISMLYGLGFPPFRGGPMKYADMTGLDVLAKAGEKYAARGLGKLYEPPKLLLEMAKAGKKFYPS
jgi:3-hydroxyacyl-CoA dehydrogenase/enoyl-CoA hydratase/3-hydroxybutyryl-CoA epimerase/enoyl-CoA isomerase